MYSFLRNSHGSILNPEPVKYTRKIFDKEIFFRWKQPNGKGRKNVLKFVTLQIDSGN